MKFLLVLFFVLGFYGDRFMYLMISTAVVFIDIDIFYKRSLDSMFYEEFFRKKRRFFDIDMSNLMD